MSDHNVCVDIGSRDAAFKVYNASHTMRLIRYYKDKADPVGSMFYSNPLQLIESLFFQRGFLNGVPITMAGLIQVSLVDPPSKKFYWTPRSLPPLVSSMGSHDDSFILGLTAGGETDLEKISGESASVPVPLPAREGDQPEGSGKEASLSPGKAKGTRDPHYRDSDNDQRTMLMMLLQIQQHAPEWMLDHELHSNVLLVLLALRKSGLAWTFERLATWLSYSSVAAVPDWIVELHKRSSLSLRSAKEEIPSDGSMTLLVATAARAIHRIVWLKVDSLKAGYRTEWSPSRRVEPGTTALGHSGSPGRRLRS
jgi:hypothetical protein